MTAKFIKHTKQTQECFEESESGTCLMENTTTTYIFNIKEKKNFIVNYTLDFTYFGKIRTI